MPRFRHGCPLLAKRRSAGQSLTKLAALVRKQQRLLDEAEEEALRLRSRHALIAGLVDSLEWLDGGAAASPPHDASGDDSAAAAAAAAAAATASAAAGRASDAAQLAPCSAEAGSIAPLDDPLSLFRLLMMHLPALPEVADWGMPQLHAHYVSVVQELALQLALLRRDTGPSSSSSSSSATQLAAPQALQAQPPAAQAQPSSGPAQRIQATLMHHMRVLTSLARLQRAELVFELQLLNADTGALAHEPGLARHAEVLAARGGLPGGAGQRERLCEAYATFSALLEPVMAELKALQQQSAAPPHSSAPGTADAAPGPGLAAADGAAAPGAPPASTGAWEREWQRQEAVMLRVQQLMAKDVWLKAAFCCCVYGSFSWLSLAEMLLQLWPRTLYAAGLARLVAQQAACG